MGKNIENFQTIVFDGTFGFRKKRILGKKQFIKTLLKLIQNLNFEHFKIWIIGLLKLGKMSEHPVPTFP